MEQTASNTPDAADEKQHNAVQDDVHIDPQEEKALLRKLDRWIVPPVMLLYLFSLVLRTASYPLDATHTNPSRSMFQSNVPSRPTTTFLDTRHSFSTLSNTNNLRQFGPRQHRQRTPLRHGRRPEPRTEPVSDRSLPDVRHIHRQRATK
jgi:hypothetical protein